MTTFNRVLLSGSTSGKPIALAATATPGTLIHTAIAGSLAFDELYLWVSNVTALPASLTVEWGGVTAPGDLSMSAVPIPANSPPTLISAGMVLNAGSECRAFSSVAGALNIVGFVNRIQ